MRFSRLIADFVRRHWMHYASAAAMLATIAMLSVWVPRKVGAVVDGLVAQRLAGRALLLDLGELLAAGIAIYFLRVGWRLQLFSAAYEFGVEIRTRLYARLSLQGPSFYQRQRTGDLMALATNDADAVEMAAGEAMLAGFDGTLTLAMVLAMMFLAVDWRLTLAALLPFPFMAFAFWRISGRLHHASGQALNRFGNLNDHVQETLAGVRTLRALGLEQRSARQFAALAEQAAAANADAQRWEASYEPAVGISLTMAGTIALAAGGYLVWQDSLTIGALTTFSMYLGQLIWPMFASGWVLALIERARAAWGRLAPVLEEPLSVDDHGTIGTLRPGTIEAEALSLAYPGQAQRALDQVSFSLAPGQTLGLVGPTGAGKSSLLRLLLRQYLPAEGSLRWSGHALESYTLEALRSAISWVPQEPFLFSASIADNISLGRPGASPENIERAARLAAVHDDIMRFPSGYATPVGERGITLSGGQRQRIAIARALLSDSALLLLDDALSAVDTGTEAQILAHLREARAGRTVVIAGHRLSAVADADHIIVLRHGRIAEQGTHAGLLARDGWYAHQWRYQQLEASLDAL
ncbi:ATP-binding cassette domain-containing protein [Noviherbaspirillum galbum]|uniref:ATP-binding cassette domain-containing protein n=1 Tax=Noviherbaspirillum galbum TaxID=2709383 RepID=A0A6B3SYR3_9BURK|nr:ATP-binding cassette domain-containing protein [Noviherbaspirillum galbum]NEX63982.1 ATP-binding cassette domain-containing protein [Noviherbaspirillum galbum]